MIQSGVGHRLDHHYNGLKNGTDCPTDYPLNSQIRCSDPAETMTNAIQSYAYDIIKQEGIQQGIQQGELRRTRVVIFSVLEARFGLMPENIIHAIKRIETLEVLAQLHRKTVKVKDLPTFSQIIQRILRPV